MIDKDASSLLFGYDPVYGQLFKNQLDLVLSLVDTPESDYYVNRNNHEEYAKTVNRLKAYISQLLSEGVTRKISKEFDRSLRAIISRKLTQSNISPQEICNTIISDIQKKNQRTENLQLDISMRKISKQPNIIENFITRILDAEYISVFTPREIKFEYEGLGEKNSLVDLLLSNLFSAFKNESSLKHYRFNFPLEQTCQLFWRGLKKELSKQIYNDKNSLSSIIALVTANKISEAGMQKFDEKIHKNREEKIASDILEYLSANEVINVFHLKAPIYLVPSITLNPNNLTKASTFIFLQSDDQIEQIHRLSSEELLLWKFFVWDNLKRNKFGTLVKYSPYF